MEPIEHFTPLIQLITAVNFAFILVSFLERLFSLLFNEEQIKARYFSSIGYQLDLCGDSLNKLNPPHEPAWEVFWQKVSRLKTKCNSYKAQVDPALTMIQDEANKIKQTQGVKSFFLFISMYCCLDLLGIGLIGCIENSQIHVALTALNLSVLYCCICFTLIIRKNKWASKRPESCHVTAIVYMFCCLCFTFLVCSIFLFLKIDSIPLVVSTFTYILCVLLPFYPIVFIFWYYSDGESKVVEKAQATSKTIYGGIVDVLAEKNKLESTYYTMTNEADIKWEGE